MQTPSTAQLSLVALLGVALLLFLIVGRKWHAFVALLLVSLLIGLGAQWPHFDPDAVLQSMQQGMGGTLGFVAVVVGLGAMFGQLLESSGGALVLARGLLQRGQRFTPAALGIAGFLISIPVFFDVAFVVLAPVLYGLARDGKRPLMAYALPLMAGMVVTHAFVPPTPGPIGVAAILGADLGLVALYGIVAGLPSMLLAGPVLARWVVPRVAGTVPAELAAAPEGELPSSASALPPPSFGVVITLIALPMVLIFCGTFAKVYEGLPGALRGACMLFGHPFVALLVATLSCFWVLGKRRGVSAEKVNELASRALEPAGIIILVTGAGGVLKQVMIDSNVGRVLADQLAGFGLTPLLLGFGLAWVVRVMQGSATVAMLTAAGLLVPIVETLPTTPHLRALQVIAVASGATCSSIVNDSGFWLVGRYLGLNVRETLGSWSLMTTVVGVCGLAVSVALSWLLV